MLKGIKVCLLSLLLLFVVEAHSSHFDAVAVFKDFIVFPALLPICSQQIELFGVFPFFRLSSYIHSALFVYFKISKLDRGLNPELCDFGLFPLLGAVSLGPFYPQ